MLHDADDDDDYNLINVDYNMDLLASLLLLLAVGGDRFISHHELRPSVGSLAGKLHICPDIAVECTELLKIVKAPNRYIT